MARRVGILTGGGDAPGLNAVLRGFVLAAARHGDLEVVGIQDAFNGLMETPRRCVPLDPKACRGLLGRGGTILGTTNRGDPFSFPGPNGSRIDRSAALQAGVKAEGLEGLVCIGGDGSQAIALRVMDELGIPVIGVPKTIDNDLDATDVTFGFYTAVDRCAEALDRLHTTAESHDRVLLLEVMGRDAGHIALYAGLAGGVDAILLPEIPWDPERIAAKIQRRQAIGRPFSILVVAEGALPLGQATSDFAERKRRLAAGGGAAAIAQSVLSSRIEAEMRTCVLGHLQRGGSPNAFDRILATRFGVAAAGLVAAGRWGEMICLRGNHVGSVPLRDAVARHRGVALTDELLAVARATGIELGADLGSDA